MKERSGVGRNSNQPNAARERVPGQSQNEAGVPAATDEEQKPAQV